MSRKRKNPFATTNEAQEYLEKSSENMSLQELRKEFNRLEKAVGKEEFNRILGEAIAKLGVSQEDETPYDKEALEYAEEPYDDVDMDFHDQVTTLEWIQTHPANLVCGSDSYYAELANDLCRIISTYNIQIENKNALTRELGRVLAAYFEDIVSETKVFSSMRRICIEKYGYRLPFYDCDHEDYMADHINEEDIRFLIWKTACLYGKENDKTYSPLSPGWSILAYRIFDELNARYEEAPEATRVADWLRRAFRKGDYIDIRECATWLFFRNPMTYMPGLMDSVQEEMMGIADEANLDPQMTAQLLYSTIANESWQRSMSPMGCPSKSLVSAMASEFGFDTMAKDIEEIEVRPKQIYAMSQNRKSRQLFFETSGHEKLQVERESLAKGFKADMIEYAECVLIKYRGKYLLNGALRGGDPRLKQEWEDQNILPAYEKQRKYAEEWIKTLEGKQAVCVKDLKTLYMKLDLPESRVKEFPDAKNYVVLISKELGIAVLPDMGYAFDIPGNRFFKKRAAAKDSFGELIFHNAMPQDVAFYIQNHNLLPEACIDASQGKETGHRIVQDYMAFWIGFYCELPAYGSAPRAEYYGERNTN